MSESSFVFYSASSNAASIKAESVALNWSLLVPNVTFDSNSWLAFINKLLTFVSLDKLEIAGL